MDPASALSRAKSFQEPGRDAPDMLPRYQTATPSLLTRFRLGTLTKRSKDPGSGSSAGSAPLDDLICLDSFEEACDSGEPRVDVTRDAVRIAIQDQLRAIGSHVDVIADLEAGRAGAPLFKTYSHYERNVALLALTMLDRHELLEPLLALDVDEAFHEAKFGLGALHVAALFGATQITELLLRRGASVNPAHGAYSPLHCAALGDHAEILQRLCKAGASVEKCQPAGETALASAVRAHSAACVRVLVELGADVNVADSCGATPLHVAADLGDAETARALLDSARCFVDCVTRTEQNTALHLAAQGGSCEIVKLLLGKGASPNARNARQKTPLHFSSKVCLECTELLLKAGADANAEDAEQRTPLHTAVARSEVRFGADMTALLLRWGAAVSRQDRYGYTPLHIAALNELPDCAEALVLHGADVTTRTRGGTAALGLVARKTPSALNAVRSVLDSYISCNDPEVSYREVKLSFNFKYLLQGCERGEMNFLQTVVDEGQRGLLEHPLCEAFLHLKWQKIRKYYTARLLFCLLLVALLSAYVLLVLAYKCYDPQPTLKLASRTFLTDKLTNLTLCANKSRLGEWLEEHPGVVTGEWLVLAVVTCLEVLRKIYGMNGYKSVREYFSLSNVVEWFVVAAVVATSFIFINPQDQWTNHVGAFAVLIGWANLMVMIGHLPVFGSYVAMYTKVQKEFAKLLSAYICLLIGFTVCFCAIFVKASAFDNPFVGFVKILVMMTGEFEFGTLLQDIGNESKGGAADATTDLLQASALITFVLFLLFVTIILINLLIGIAVHDIQGLQKTAGLSKLVGLTNLISHIEAALFGRRVPTCVVRLLSSTSGVASLVTVNPLNAREQRLPRGILRAGLDVARLTRGNGHGKRSAEDKRHTFMARRSETIGDGPSQDLAVMVAVLSDQVRELKELLLASQRH